MLIETSRETKAKRLFTAPKFMNKIHTFGIMTGENPDAIQMSSNTNSILNANFESWLKRTGYQYYKVKGKYGSVEHSYLIYNVALADMIIFATDFRQQSFIFCRNVNGKLTFEFWANRAKNNKYSYKKVDEQVIYSTSENFENEYTQISRDFKFNIPFEKFTVSTEDMIERFNNKLSPYDRKCLLDRSLNESLTYMGRTLARCRLYCIK